MAPRDAITRTEARALAAAGVFRADGADAWRSIGLCHRGQRDLSVKFYYHADKGDIGLQCFAKCEYEVIKDAFGLTDDDLHDEPRGTVSAWSFRPARPVVEVPQPIIYPAAPYGWRPPKSSYMRCGHEKLIEYLYANAEACVAFGVCRCVNKCFRQWRWDPEARDGRRWSVRQRDGHGNVIATVATLPYMLPQLIAAVADERLIWITEGEKDARRLVEAGLAATCNAGGAGKWTDGHAAYLKGADVRVVADRDEPGKQHALHVIDTLGALARSIDLVQAAHGKDAFDHFAAGGDETDFVVVGEPKPLLLEVR